MRSKGLSWAVLLLLASLFWLNAGAGAQIEVPERLDGPRITLYYPASLIAAADAEAFLAEQEEELAQVEALLGTPYPGRLQITIESDWFSRYSGATDRFGRRIIYIYEYYPLYRLNTTKRTPIHELVHAVTLRGWGLSHPLLMEGIAVALDTADRGLQSPELISLALLRRGELPGLDVRQEELSWLDYYPAGSLVRYLLERYGVERFRRFYRGVGRRYWAFWGWVQRTWPSEEEFEARAEAVMAELDALCAEVYGLTLAELQRDWEDSLREFAPLAERAELALQALLGWAGVWQLRTQLGGLKEIGLLGPVPERLRQAQREASRRLFTLVTGTEAEGAHAEFAAFREALQGYQALLESWWEAASGFMGLKELFYYGAVDPEAAQEELRAIREDYAAVGDAVMVALVERYLEGFAAYAAGLEAINTIACEEGLRELRQAQAIFAELGEEGLVEAIREVLAPASCYQPA